jgi:GNAT superfamily N-acetyltransferase
MSLPDDLALRDATMDDYAGIAAMREGVGWDVTGWALRAVIGQPDARCVVAEAADGTLAGVGSGIVYGPMGFIGNMVVAEAHRRRGVGSAILEAVSTYLTDAGCVRLELNATSDGRPLYERHGFESVGTSRVARVPRSTTLGSAAETTIRTATAADLDALAVYDGPRFGGDRRRVLGIVVAGGEHTCLVAEHDGRIVGYGGLGAATGRIGPFLAEEPPIAGAILADAFARSPDLHELRLNLPPNNRGGEAWLRSLGIAVETWDGRMARGRDLPKRDETIYGMAVGALG